jgi:2-polyprenyl-3-methyl-5-hydroxy-6-metoxy-1,4-benzoquinol methylase
MNGRADDIGSAKLMAAMNLQVLARRKPISFLARWRPIRILARRSRNLFYGITPFECPPNLRARHRPAAVDTEQRLTKSLTRHFFSCMPYYPNPDIPQYLASELGRADLRQHLFERLNNNRYRVIPWIVDATGPLLDKSVLEIGCGTGASTVAVAEQGANLLACDEHDGSLRVATDRLECYGLRVELKSMNAGEMFASIANREFDVILFLAVLEHMRLDERLQALSEAWVHIKPGGHLVIDETPNRLWYFDWHTSMEPFFMWLPDDLAERYSTRTPRVPYNQLFKKSENFDPIAFARWGRGVSYHDLALAIGADPEKLPVISCKELFFRNKTGPKRGVARRPDRRFENFIHALHPEIHDGFFLPSLDLILQKPP